jgi:hypothetical protein
MANSNIWSFKGESSGIRPKFSTPALKKRILCVCACSEQWSTPDIGTRFIRPIPEADEKQGESSKGGIKGKG